MQLNRLMLVALSAAGFEAIYAVWTYAVARNHLALAVLATSLIPFIQLVAVAFLIDAKTWRQRAAIAAAQAVGYGFGTVAVLLLIGR